MSDLRKAAEMALEDICGAKLCETNSMSSRAEMLRLMDKAAEALRQALAQPEYQTVSAPQPQTFTGQKPVVWLVQHKDRHDFVWGEKPKFLSDKVLGIEPLYTAPPKREWVGLTDEEILDSADSFGSFQYGDAQGHKRLKFARAIEAKLKEKNG